MPTGLRQINNDEPMKTMRKIILKKINHHLTFEKTAEK